MESNMGKQDKPKADETEQAEPLEASEANEAARNEADPPAALTVEHGGITYQLNGQPDSWPMEASIAFAEILDAEPTGVGAMKTAKYVAAFLEAVLGPAGWVQFRRTNPTTGDMREMYQASFRRLMGGEPGE